MTFLGQGSDPSHSWDLHHGCNNARTLTHCSGTGIKPIHAQCSRNATDVVWATAGTPHCIFNLFPYVASREKLGFCVLIFSHDFVKLTYWFQEFVCVCDFLVKSWDFLHGQSCHLQTGSCLFLPSQFLCLLLPSLTLSHWADLPALCQAQVVRELTSWTRFPP